MIVFVFFFFIESNWNKERGSRGFGKQNFEGEKRNQKLVSLLRRVNQSIKVMNGNCYTSFSGSKLSLNNHLVRAFENFVSQYGDYGLVP